MKTRLYIFLGLLTLCAATVLVVLLQPAQAQPGANCSADYFVDETLPNGAQWQMCWEHRTREGIVFHDIFYTPPDGETRKILTQANVSQIHVPYDDNGARFHDVTDYGMGGLNMNNLKPEECPDGNLLVHTETTNAKNVMCKRVARRGHAYIGGSQRNPGYALSMFSVSPIGEYNYLPLWQFYDDGTIDLAMGASGRLQRRGTDARYGWPIRFGSGTTGISHIHNYYWYLDFDLDDTPNDDIVEEIEFIPTDNGQGRALSISRFTNEVARSVEPELMRSWRIRDDNVTNDKGQPISYHLEPLRVGHRDVGPSYEPFTENDLYVTVNRECEKFVSHNPILNNCSENVTGFINDESLENQDVVVWYGLTFHHTPRDEDENFMNMHWDGFRIIPRDWNTYNPLVDETPAVIDTPTLLPTPTLTNTVIPTAVIVPTDTIVPTDIPVLTETPELIETPVPIDTPVPTETPVPIDTAIPTDTLTPTIPSDAIIRMGSYTVTVGSEFTATIDASNVITGVATTSMEVIYNPDMLEVVSCTKDPANLFALVQCNALFARDTIRFNITGLEGISGDIILANIVFRALDGADGTSPLDMNIRVFANESGDPIDVSQVNGSVRIGNGNGVELGDVNCDARVDAVDGLFILQRDIGLRPGLAVCPVDAPATSMYLGACDVDVDTNCGAVDALFILQCDIGIANVLCPE